MAVDCILLFLSSESNRKIILFLNYPKKGGKKQKVHRKDINMICRMAFRRFSISWVLFRCVWIEKIKQLMQVITEFCKTIGADSKQRQGLIRLAKKNGEKLGFLAWKHRMNVFIYLFIFNLRWHWLIVLCVLMKILGVQDVYICIWTFTGLWKAGCNQTPDVIFQSFVIMSLILL